MRKANLRSYIVGLARLRAWVIATMFCAMSVVMFGVISGAASQTDLADQIAKADLGYGEYLAGECAACHQKSGAGHSAN